MVERPSAVVEEFFSELKKHHLQTIKTLVLMPSVSRYSIVGKFTHWFVYISVSRSVTQSRKM